MRYLRAPLVAIITSMVCPGDTSLSPALQWVQSLASSSSIIATASAIDPEGDLYITGNTAGDVFVAKLDPAGKIIYLKNFGGSAADTSAGLAAGADGSVYVTGLTASRDFPVTPGAFLSTLPPSNPGSFVFKLKPDGSLAWSTYFADSQTTPAGIAVDASGNAYLTGNTYGNLPTTPGAFQSQPPGIPACPVGSISLCAGFPRVGFLTKFKADGSGLAASTYIYPGGFNAIALTAQGNAYLAGDNGLSLMNGNGTALLASTTVKCDCSIQAITVDVAGNLFATGGGRSVPTTAGAFQTAAQPVFPVLPQTGGTPFGAFIIKFDAALSRIIASTLLGGESGDQGSSIAIGSGGTVIVAGSSSSEAFPTRSPFQSSFSDVSGFVAGLDPGLSSLLFATFVGDRRYFELNAAYPDQNGDILLAGSTLLPTGLPPICLPIRPVECLSAGNTVFANKISFSPVPAVRLDSAQNAANQLATPLSPGERIVLTGAGFGPDARLLLNGSPVQTTFQTESRLAAFLPSQLGDAGAVVLTISSKGSMSNSVVAPIAASSPGIYSADGSGYGRGFILNSDGTLNSPSNPASTGSAITLFLTGIGSFTLDGIYAVAAQPVSVFIDGFYADGIAATLQQVPGVPGETYALSVYIPKPADYASQNPNLKDYKMPPQVGVVLVSGPVLAVNPDYSAAHTQPGLSLSIKQ